MIAAALAAAVLALATAAPAQAPGGPYAPYDGHNPFNCELQRVGTGTDFPDPEADPFCVEFDKTQQNVTELGLVEFAAQEPARVAAAGPKCFYYQRDHWTGSIVQGAEPETYHFDGSYFYDKSTGSGGVHIGNFRIGGQPADASQYVAPEYKPYFGQGGGGSLLRGNVPADPRCAEKVDSRRERARVYYRRLHGGKVFRKRVTPVRLRTLRQRLLERNGPPHRRSHHTDRFDVAGGGQLGVAYRGNALDRRVAALLTTSPSHRRAGIHPGDRAHRARRALKARFAFRVYGYRVLEAPRRRRSAMLLGVRARKLAWIAVADPRRVGERSMRRTLRNLLAEAP